MHWLILVDALFKKRFQLNQQHLQLNQVNQTPTSNLDLYFLTFFTDKGKNFYPNKFITLYCLTVIKILYQTQIICQALNLIVLQILNMKNSKIISKDQTTEFIETLTNQLNDFFNKISKQGYSFECVHTPNQSDDKAIELKKAYRVFKKFLITQKLIDPELGQKARERFASRVWEQLTESQRLKYFTTKHFPPIHYLQKIVAHVANNRNSKNKSLASSKTQQSKQPQQQSISPANNGKQVSTQNKKMDKNAQTDKSQVVVIQ